MNVARRTLLLSVTILTGLILCIPAEAQYKKEKKGKQERQMSGVVSSVETSNGMMTVRLDSGDVFAAPVQKVRIRDMRQSESAKPAQSSANAAASQAGRRRAVAVSSDNIPVGSRVVVRRKLDKDGSLKRVVVRIVEQ